ncbi:MULTISPECIES: hypothetical protein [unclassified Duganella]|jgi:hypothetical protein|uniref:hypothetical protein n=1 Tax=unclassified Duganella TaxID=2636909 RepID=UPI00088F383D|nr:MULTISPECIES: hypothetical protein [unclassified Duganella]SDG77498.1 hypothetical protein SAMN05216320_10724 [Duganella sp. OV458]SDK04503.1 hypothetical protein SAMN05428973_10824 [Duganella sp. OV510]
MTEPHNRSIPEEMKVALHEWDRMAVRLTRLYALLGALSVSCSLFVATFVGTDAALTGSIRVVAFVGTASLAWIGTFNMGGKANALRSAWRLLNAACIRYKYEESYTFEELHAQYVAGESLLGVITIAEPAPKH